MKKKKKKRRRERRRATVQSSPCSLSSMTTPAAHLLRKQNWNITLHNVSASSELSPRRLKFWQIYHHYYFWTHCQYQYLHWLQYTISSATWSERKCSRPIFKGRAWTLHHTERDREDPCVLSFRTCVFNDNYDAAWRHLWFVMQIRKGHGGNTMGCICWQKNTLELANESFGQRNGSHSRNSLCFYLRLLYNKY